MISARSQIEFRVGHILAGNSLANLAPSVGRLAMRIFSKRLASLSLASRLHLVI